MKLSEAIRKGCTMLPEGPYLVAGDVEVKNFCATCALGAAMLGSGYSGKNLNGHSAAYTWLIGKFPYMTKEILREISVKHYDGMRNATKRITREQIADWVEQEYESKLPQKQRETDDSYTKRVLQSIIESAGQTKVTA